jgi:hypothetical protein
MFDMTGMNGGREGETVKLAGNWIPPATATSLAGAYRMGEWINVSRVRLQWDPDYRR